MTLQNKLKKISDALTGIDGLAVFHYFHYREELPYCIWAEDDEAASLEADGRKKEQAVRGSTDYFTGEEFDPVVDLIQGAFDNVEGISWKLNSTQFEDETKTIHYEWTWTIL